MLQDTNNYNQQPVAETLKILKLQSEDRLTDAEVSERISEYRYNEIEEKEELLWHRIFRRFWGPWMIEIADLALGTGTKVGRLQHHHGDAAGLRRAGFFYRRSLCPYPASTIFCEPVY